MTRHEFELAVIRMWTTTRVPLTRMNLLAYTHAPRERIEQWMNELVVADLAELDSDEDGEVLWRIRGAKRSTQGPRSMDEISKLERLMREVDAEPSRGLVLSPKLQTRIVDPVAIRDEKSIIASGLVSFFLGPVGWLYAAPLPEAVAAVLISAVVTSVLSAVLPYALVMGIFGFTAPVSAAVGVYYAWRYNKTGRRVSMLELVEQVKRQLPRG
jgi:hypothetical protein